MTSKKDLSALKTEIKRLAAEGRAHNPLIQAARGPERHRLRGEKAGIGWHARMALLAYAYLRGVPYRVLEPRTRETLSSFWLTRVLDQWDPSPAATPDDDVRAWLATEPASEEVAA